MRPRKVVRALPSLPLALLLAALSLALTACSDDDDGAPPAPTATETAAPTATATPVPPTETATPTEPPHEHGEIVYGSDEAGVGALHLHFDGDDHQHAAFDTCLGGSGDDCAGGIALYSSDSPGYEPTEVDEPEEMLYVLGDGATIAVEIVAIDEGFSLKRGDAIADAAGESLVLGTTPDLGHEHVEYIIAVPGGTETFSKNVTLRLIDTSETYAPSEPLTLNFRRAHD